ncbi:hypothetical protein [Catellatospora vulcania]|uniref:hypothetical protein n=1 Tax=Catellatospora vulcania TaxID=1460450 RepID=UPI0012D3A363|nr:hypothetical protein [Catellatospora vulcania]
MTSIEVLSEAIWAIASAEQDLDAEAVASLFRGQGWQIAGSSSLPFPRKWCKDEIQASIYGRRDPSIELVWKEIQPDWDDASYVEAVEGGYARQVGEVEDVRNSLFEYLLGQAVPVLVSDVSEIEEFIVGSDWAISGAILSIGVAHLDKDDLPILLMIYVRQNRR